MNCLGSVVLPRAETFSEWADSGHEEHAELARQVVDGTLPDWLAAIVPAGARPEVALAFDVATGVGRIVGENLGRSYGDMGPFEICGSTDVVGVEGDAVVIIDWKTGFREVDPAATNLQLAFYALAAARALGKNRAIVRIVYTKMHRIDEAELDALDLADLVERLRSLHVRVAKVIAAKRDGEQVATKEGSWCRHCASRAHCPSKTALLVQVATQGLAVIGDSEMTPERAAAAYEQINKIDQLVQDAKKRLDTFVEERGPIDLGNGKAYGRYHRKGNERIDGDVAVKAIREVIGDPDTLKRFETEAVERKIVVTKAAIDRAAKAVGGGASLAKSVIAKVRDLGGVTSTATYPVGEYTIGKDQPAPRGEIDVAAMNRALAEAG